MKSKVHHSWKAKDKIRQYIREHSWNRSLKTEHLINFPFPSPFPPLLSHIGFYKVVFQLRVYLQHMEVQRRKEVIHLEMCRVVNYLVETRVDNLEGSSFSYVNWSCCLPLRSAWGSSEINAVHLGTLSYHNLDASWVKGCYWYQI